MADHDGRRGVHTCPWTYENDGAVGGYIVVAATGGDAGTLDMCEEADGGGACAGEGTLALQTDGTAAFAFELGAPHDTYDCTVTMDVAGVAALVGADRLSFTTTATFTATTGTQCADLELYYQELYNLDATLDGCAIGEAYDATRAAR